MNTISIVLIATLVAEPIPTLDFRALKKEQDECWAQLMSGEKNDIKALFKFSARPKETILFLKEKLKPLKLELSEAKKRIKELESGDERIRKSAFETLRVFDPRLAMSAKAAFDFAAPGVGQTRLVALLCGYDPDSLKGLRFTYSEELNTAIFKSGNHRQRTALHVKSIWSCYEWHRQTRATILLEHIGTNEAINLLKHLATGHPDASPTREAIDALNRLSNPCKLELDSCWDDLKKGNYDEIRSVLNFSQQPRETVPFFKSKIKPVKTEKDTVLKMLKDLQSDKVTVWKPAFEYLDTYDPRLVMSLKEAFDEVPAGIGQPRIVAILFGQSLKELEGKEFTLEMSEENASFRCENHYWSCSLEVKTIFKVSWHRLNHAVLLLEHIGTLEAIDMLKTMTKGHPDAAPTRAARDALKRLKAD